VLADPVAFVGETLADPLEGIAYGVCKAKIMRRADGTPWIHSFAHGRTVYDLKLDAAAIRAALAKTAAEEVVVKLVALLPAAEVTSTEEEALVAYAKERTGSGIRAINRQLKKAGEEKAAKDADEAYDRRIADRDDPRQWLPVPANDAPWLPEMTAYNAILGAVPDRIPPGRGIDGEAVAVERIPSTQFHPFTTANDEEA
jgi:hypothetical protein